MVNREVPDKFKIGLSFASEQLDYVRSLADAIERRLGKSTVFFYEWYPDLVAGTDADQRLQRIYSKQCELVVVCFSKEYKKKTWTLTEYEAIRAVNMQLRASDDPKAMDRIFPMWTGTGQPEAELFNTILADIRSMAVDDAAQVILRRLRSVNPAAVSRAPASRDRFIYLAECTPDREDPAEPVNRQRLKSLIESAGWNVLPAQEYSAAEYRERLNDDLERASAFVQLLGRYRWKPEDFDRLQDDSARQQGLKRFVYRSKDLDLGRLEPAHAEYLKRPEVIATGFDDFLEYLKEELKQLAQALSAAAVRAPGENRPLVRVVARSNTPDDLWDRGFNWIVADGGVLSELVKRGDTFETDHEREPCQGFLILCDAAALDEESSLRADLTLCRRLQVAEREQARRPPVALVYWPPPETKTSRLVKAQPDKLRVIMVDPSDESLPGDLAKFFNEVRETSR